MIRLRHWPTWTERPLFTRYETPSLPNYPKELWTPSRGGILRLSLGWFTCWDRRFWETCSRSTDLWVVIGHQFYFTYTYSEYLLIQWKEKWSLSYTHIIYLLEAHQVSIKRACCVVQLTVWLSKHQTVNGMLATLPPTCPLSPFFLFLKTFRWCPFPWSCNTPSVASVKGSQPNHSIALTVFFKFHRCSTCKCLYFLFECLIYAL